VISAARRRRKSDRQSRTLVTRAGRECQVRMVVPVKRMTRRGVRMYSGGRVRATQTGETKRMRMKSVVKAGRVVAEVGVRCVERKSVIARNGSRRMLHREVNCASVSTISSSDLLWEDEEDSTDLECFSPVVEVEESGEYRLEYMPSMRKTTRMSGPAYWIT
jgi:hypothetical protein